LIAVAVFVIELQDREEDRVNRERDLVAKSWATVSQFHPDNEARGGLKDAVETLVKVRANTNQIQLPGADLYDANLSRGRFYDANFKGASLWKANFTEANLTKAKLNGANLSEADLTRADLIDADLRDVVPALTQEQLDVACGSSTTDLSGDLSIPKCADVDWFQEVHGDLPDIYR